LPNPHHPDKISWFCYSNHHFFNLIMPHNFCVHGHFYQPPREDPLTDLIPDEPGAAPYINWNERIYDHCYRPNAAYDNFRKVSFNLGPTLFRWLERYHPDTYQQILNQERLIYQRYQASNAMAQAFYHPILPLASPRDKFTQIIWGMRDYKHRFGHAADGMWLPECAMDIDTLEILADQEIDFTILAPWQANTDQLDITKPYRVELPSGNSITVFFYEGFLSGLISFDPPSTTNADDFVANKLLSTYPQNGNEDPLIMLASDGELYGHHQLFRDQFLSHLLDGAAEASGLNVTFPAVWLQDHTAEETIQLRPNTSWSCHHGLERWRAVCDDGPASTWKAPLRYAFEHLAKEIDLVYEDVCRPFCDNPWDLRDEYVDVLLGEIAPKEFLHSFANPTMGMAEEKVLLRLLDAQDNRIKMFVSDTWFFEEFDRIEPRNAIHFATYAVWQVKQAVGVDLTPVFREDLAQVKSSTTGSSGEQIFSDYWNWLGRKDTHT
jgi:alpha-amylase/alpha-mannosidase (GH57 family)